MHQHLHFDMAISAASLRQQLLNSAMFQQRWPQAREIHCINGTLNASNSRYVIKIIEGTQEKSVSLAFTDEGPLIREVWRGEDYFCQIDHAWSATGWSLDASWQLRGFRNRFAKRRQQVLQGSLASGFNRLAMKINSELALEN
ncbi:hypothetical protein [Salinibius halmophilus]|uniref:hypothetical protein n=1 Tax=Salinibius halmophilus TaxID=1853216 RepID=UPI000E663FBD|nr:hypothetical protein [Salinibius halmophilus]